MQPLRVLFSFLVFFTLSILYCQRNFTHDPTSYYFDERAYQPLYSRYREAQALDFIRRSTPSYERPSSAGSPGVADTKHIGAQKTCLGIITMKRHNKQHFPATLGSLLDSLSPAERASIHVIVYFTDLVPQLHPSYGAPWVAGLVDQVLVQPEHSVPGRAIGKAVADYRRLLHACYSADTPYVVIVEDDIIAARHWYERTMGAVDGLEVDRAWLFLRLFYSETFLGWNSGEWGMYMVWIGQSVVVVVVALLVVSRLLGMVRPGWKISKWTVGVVVGVCVPLMWVLYFLAGRLSMQPLPLGVTRMDRYGCCSQGLVFAREKLPLVLHELEPGVTPMLMPDQRIEALADRSRLARWALVPSVFQHVGRESSSGEPKKTWNFQFELTREVWQYLV